ncbi:putative transmembrane protein [Gregarina niphandrodes]|uniref:Transmembrane protein n=1 Tax=Gregarina niphandrodes TaxID=110365 RepID=A0A023BC85_GRENI|nr:putative transmembrane protein [Gregarina niphandrodes]EZG82438.1 putative transmembrane protein [Gregarina niphandrodes]|eukprot:XP_011129007.1 putative transmembrane protein [Gregarina niphandrodes]
MSPKLGHWSPELGHWSAELGRWFGKKASETAPANPSVGKLLSESRSQSWPLKSLALPTWKRSQEEVKGTDGAAPWLPSLLKGGPGNSSAEESTKNFWPFWNKAEQDSAPVGPTARFQLEDFLGSTANVGLPGSDTVQVAPSVEPSSNWSPRQWATQRWAPSGWFHLLPTWSTEAGPEDDPEVGLDGRAGLGEKVGPGTSNSHVADNLVGDNLVGDNLAVASQEADGLSMADSVEGVNWLPDYDTVLSKLRCDPVQSFASCAQHCFSLLSEFGHTRAEDLTLELVPRVKGRSFAPFWPQAAVSRSAATAGSNEVYGMTQTDQRNFRVCILDVCAHDYVVGTALPGCLGADGRVIEVPSKVDGPGKVDGPTSYDDLDFYEPRKMQLYNTFGVFTLGRWIQNLLPECDLNSGYRGCELHSPGHLVWILLAVVIPAAGLGLFFAYRHYAALLGTFPCLRKSSRHRTPIETEKNNHWTNVWAGMQWLSLRLLFVMHRIEMLYRRPTGNIVLVDQEGELELMGQQHPFTQIDR